jgi:hypothetical protein
MARQMKAERELVVVAASEVALPSLAHWILAEIGTNGTLVR